MFFTREDILKIQNALLQLSVKDSELPSAEPVTYDDTLSIVQDGKNKQIGIKEFFNQISLWKREDFLNITDKYDEHYISLIEAINLVPVLQRKDGLVITFQDVEGNWEIYQFRGNITEFFNIEKWFNLYDYRNNIIQSIVPDEEDLTASTPNENGNSLVSLKDRVYDPTSFSGKGYKILRKNIIDGKNILTQEMINRDNTVYEIRYDFDLNGTLLVDKNIEFVDNGGSLSNGKIKVKRGCVLTLPNETLINPLYIDGKIEFKNKPVLNDNLEVAISWFTNRRDLFVDNAYKIGIRKFNLCSHIWAELQNDEYVLTCNHNNYESEFVLDIDTYLDYIEDRVLDVTEIKLHQDFPEGFFRSNEQIYNDLRNKYISYVKECIDKIYNRKELGIKRLSVFNEQAYLSNWWQSDEEVIIAKNMISEITEYGESKGILISISYAGPELFVTRYVPDNVTNFEPTVNSYPHVSFSGLNSIPVSSMFEREESVNNFDKIKYISEIGITSRTKALATPGAYQNIGDYDYTGTIQYVFWSSVLNSQFIQKMEHVSMWYVEVWTPNDIIKIKSLVNRYKYGK